MASTSDIHLSMPEAIPTRAKSSSTTSQQLTSSLSNLGKPTIINGVRVRTSSCKAEMAETLPFWNIYQGGLQTNKKIYWASLCGDDPSEAEILTDRVCITRVKVVQAGDVAIGRLGTLKTRVDGGRTMIQERHQMVLILSNKHPQIQQYGIEDSYALCSYWVMTEIFEIWRNGNRIVLARYDKALLNAPDDAHKTWWTTETTLVKDNVNKQTCTGCGVEAPVRYAEGFCCANLECETSKTASAAIASQLTYTQDYLEYRPKLENLPAPPTAYDAPIPKLLTIEELEVQRLDKTQPRPGGNGYMCQHCDCTNMRVFWNRLQCRKCGDKIMISLPEVGFENLIEPIYQDISEQTINSKCIVDYGARDVSPAVSDPAYIVKKWEVDAGQHMIMAYPNKDAIAGMYDLPVTNDIYRELLKLINDGTLQLRRLPSSNTSEDQVGILTNWFGLNMGEVYNTTFDLGLTVPFSQTHPLLLNWKAQVEAIVYRLTGHKVSYNEMLLVGMYPKNGMNWHSDNEADQTAGRVTSISIGSTADMFFKAKESLARGKNPDDPIVYGTQFEAEKRKLKAKLERGEITEEEMKAQWKALPFDMSAVSKTKLIFPLAGTGSIMIQEGDKINDTMVHSTLNTGKFRFVITFRELKKREVEAKPGKKGGKKRKAEEDGVGEGEDGTKKKTRKAVRGAAKAKGRRK